MGHLHAIRHIVHRFVRQTVSTVARAWFLELTGEDTLKSWHRARLTTPPTHELSVAWDEREVAKEHGARWDPQLKSWVLRSRAPLDEWAKARVKAQSVLRTEAFKK